MKPCAIPLSPVSFALFNRWVVPPSSGSLRGANPPSIGLLKPSSIKGAYFLIVVWPIPYKEWGPPT